MMGVSTDEMVKAVKEAGASIIGSNCGNGFEQMIEIIRDIRNVDPSTPILVQANAGLPIYKDGKTIYPDTPEMMSPRVNELINSGANIIGGCCGTTPAHIRALANEIKKN
jgi:5-methyltetrahydrofolate--homocysteine methyltransferase